MRRNRYRNWIYILIVGVVGISLPNKLDAQTWVTTDYWDQYHGTYMNRDSTEVGPYQMCKTPNGNIYMLIQENMDDVDRLVLFDANGQILSSTYTSHSGGIFSEFTGSLKPCQDNGVVYNMIHSNGLGDYSKTFRTGINSWSKTSVTPFVLVKDVIPTFYNTTLLEYYNSNDSLVEVDSTGNFMRFKYLQNNFISCVQDSDLIVFENNRITKQDWNGIIKWAANDSNFRPISCDTSNIYCFRNDSVIKMHTKDGSVVWTKVIPHQYANYFNWPPIPTIAILRDSGLIVTNGFEISRYDSSGTLLWTKSDSLPTFRFGAIIEDSAGYILTGGAYLSIDATYGLLQRGFGYFVTRLDSNGNGTLDSTNQYFTGNANDNNIVSFSDDGPNIGAALGIIGQPLLPIHQQTCMYGPISAFGPDWSGSFTNGLNYKFCDADGNGIIDTNDLHVVSFSFSGPWGSPVYPHWRKSSITSNTNLIVDIVEDTLMPGDSATILLRLDPSTDIDSIYSIAFDLSFFNLQSNNGAVAYDQAGNFGVPGINVFNYFRNYPSGIAAVRYLMSKNDHLNSSLHADTLLKIRMGLSGGINGNQPLSVMCHAITNGGYDVSFNIINDSIYFFDPNTQVNESGINPFSIMPNPGNGFFNISSSLIIDELLVMDLQGKIIVKRSNPVNQIDISDQPDGIYFVQIKSNNQIFRQRFAVIH
jgi:hypothetical protein